MELQYLSDAAGNHTAVVIPIEEWKSLTNQYDGLKKLEEQPQKKSKPSDFEGILPVDIADAMQAYLKQSREEWG